MDPIGCKRKSYECFKPYCNSRVLIYEIVIVFFLSPLYLTQEIPWPWGCAGKGSSTAAGAGHAAQGTRARGRGPHLGELERAGPRPKPWPVGGRAEQLRRRRQRSRLQGPRAHGPGAGHCAAGTGVRGIEVLHQTLEIEENEEQEWRSSPGKKTLAGAEAKYVDCQRFRDPIDEPNVLRRSPRRDERNGTLGSSRRFTDWE
jgi:hypothetical protein